MSTLYLSDWSNERHRHGTRRRMGESRGEEGAVLIIVALTLAAVVAMVGLAMDAGVLYLTRQRAQAAADAAAQAGAMDIYNGTSADHGSSNATWYAQQNGFNTA